MDEISAGVRDRIVEKIVPLNDTLSHLPSTVADEERILAKLRYGQLDWEWANARAGTFSGHAGPVRILTGSNRLAALWWPNPAAAGSRRLRVFTF